MSLRAVLFYSNLAIILVLTAFMMVSIINVPQNEFCYEPWTSFVVPFRNRTQHLPIFVQAINAHQQANGKRNFNIIIVEQDDNNLFNRGKLLNVGATEAVKLIQNQCGNSMIIESSLCLIFHDVDMIPINKKIPYSCKNSPMLLATAAQQFGYRMMYSKYFGGAVAIKWSHFVHFNGFANRFWGWGGEDDDLYARVTHSGFNISYLPENIGRFKCLKHEKSKENKERFSQLKYSIKLIEFDGLKNLGYKLNQLVSNPDYIHIHVDLLGS